MKRNSLAWLSALSLVSAVYAFSASAESVASPTTKILPLPQTNSSPVLVVPFRQAKEPLPWLRFMEQAPYLRSTPTTPGC